MCCPLELFTWPKTIKCKRNAWHHFSSHICTPHCCSSRKHREGNGADHSHLVLSALCFTLFCCLQELVKTLSPANCPGGVSSSCPQQILSQDWTRLRSSILRFMLKWRRKLRTTSSSRKEGKVSGIWFSKVRFPSRLNCSLSKPASWEMQSDSKRGAISVAFVVWSKSKNSPDAVWILNSWMLQQDLLHYE